MRLVAAPDKFRGTATAAEVADAIAAAAAVCGWEADVCPVADGGEGTIDALGGANRTATVTGPLGEPVEAGWRMAGRTAVIEMAAASGLGLVGGAEHNDAVAASTRGTGELIQLAVESGAKTIIVCLGGSATTDGGLGAIGAISTPARLRAVEFLVACDVRTTFVDAATTFGPQKGASAAQVRLLGNRLNRLADVYAEDYGVDVRELPGSGAAGGLAGGLAALGAQIVDGFDVVADHLRLDERIETADLVVTGEGYLDDESFDGKVVGSVLELASSLDVPTLAIVGDGDAAVLARLHPGLRVESLVARYGRERALADTVEAIRATTEAHLQNG